MHEIPTLMDEVVFKEYLSAAKHDLAESGLISYTSKLGRLSEIITVTAGQKDEKYFSASQLKQIFDLAK